MYKVVQRVECRDSAPKKASAGRSSDTNAPINNVYETTIYTSSGIVTVSFIETTCQAGDDNVPKWGPLHCGSKRPGMCV